MKILIIEDNPAYRQAAQTYFSELNDIEVEYATGYEEGLTEMEGKDGLLVDILMPAPREVTEQVYSLIESVVKRKEKEQMDKYNPQKSWTWGSALPQNTYSSYYLVQASLIDSQKVPFESPAGILIAHEASKRGIPFCLVTDRHHHSHDIEIYLWYISEMCWNYLEGQKRVHGETEDNIMPFYKTPDRKGLMVNPTIKITEAENDSYPHKEKAEYWQNAFSTLMELINKPKT